jgi:hypothetical protein
LISSAIGRGSSASGRNAAFPADPGWFRSPKKVTRRIRVTGKPAKDIRDRYSDELLGNPLTGRPRDIVLIYSQHFCSKCRKYFNADTTDLADPGSHYTRRVIDAALRLVIEDGLPYRSASWTLWREHRVFVPYATIQNWVEAGGEKGEPTDRHRLPRLGAVRLLGLYRRRRVV